MLHRWDTLPLQAHLAGLKAVEPQGSQAIHMGCCHARPSKRSKLHGCRRQAAGLAGGSMGVQVRIGGCIVC